MIKIKASDYVALFLREQGIRNVFIVSGGASIHLLHSLEETVEISPIPVHHEQAAGMAADGYARASGIIGAAIATSGPGATNLITAIAGAWFDSIPIIFITGQVATFRMKKEIPIRQLGFQETDIVSMAKSITKKCIQVTSTVGLDSILHDSVRVAISDRPGPVLVDIPDDIQRSFGEFSLPLKVSPVSPKTHVNQVNDSLQAIGDLIKNASRPVMIFGAGANNPETRDICRRIASDLKIPILLTWRAKDLVYSDCPFLVGTFGSHGTRWGNFAVQNADLVIVLGSRLSTRETGGNIKNWARGAKLVHIDVDGAEMDKLVSLGKMTTIRVEANLIDFLPKFHKFILSNLSDYSVTEWVDWIEKRKDEYSYRVSSNYNKITGYDFFKILESFLEKSEHLFLDTGCTVAWGMQSLDLKGNVRVHHDCNNTAMGWALPAAIGGSLASPGSVFTCISGDGSLMMNLQELATLKRHGKFVRVIVLNNLGYAMVRQTERQWLNGQYVGTDSRNGHLDFPDFVNLAQSFGIQAASASTHEELRRQLHNMYINKNIQFLEVMIDPESEVIPNVVFGKPLEDSEPLLDRNELRNNMLIPLLDN